MKYIVKNCPCGYAIADTIACTNNEGYQKWCEYTDDCIIKQIIDKCKEDCVIIGDEELRFDTLDDIISMFEIESVE